MGTTKGPQLGPWMTPHKHRSLEAFQYLMDDGEFTYVDHLHFATTKAIHKQIGRVEGTKGRLRTLRRRDLVDEDLPEAVDKLITALNELKDAINDPETFYMTQAKTREMMKDPREQWRWGNEWR